MQNRNRSNPEGVFEQSASWSKMPKKRKRGRPSCKGGRARVIERLIKMKVKCNFSAGQLKEIMSLYETEEAQLIKKIVQKELRQNYSAIRLHGCSTCEDFVWIAGENMDCDNCHNQAGRYVSLIFFLSFVYSFC